MATTTSAGTTTVAWDEDERATAMSGPGLSAFYAYNGEGTRLRAVENGSARYEIRDGAGVTAPLLNDNQANYTPGISRRSSTGTTFDVAGLKSVAAQTSLSGAVSATRQYDAFGNVLASSGSFLGPFGYGGAFGYREDASGLKLLGHRLYDSSAGRFLSRDPARDGRNWYAYCGNDPVDLADEDGLEPEWVNPVDKLKPKPKPSDTGLGYPVNPHDPPKPVPPGDTNVGPVKVGPGGVSVGDSSQSGNLSGSGSVTIYPKPGASGGLGYDDGKGNTANGSGGIEQGGRPHFEFGLSGKLGPVTGSITGGSSTTPGYGFGFHPSKDGPHFEIGYNPGQGSGTLTVGWPIRL